MLNSCSVSSQNLTYEIILTLGQAFEVAYQLALQAQKSRPLGASAAETIETKSSKPVPKPRVGTRKSAVRGPRLPRPPLPGFEGSGWSRHREGLLGPQAAGPSETGR